MDIQSLIAAAQAAGGGGAPAAPAAGDPMQMLQALLKSGVNPAGQGGGASPMLNALATAQAGSPRAPAIPGGGVPENMGMMGAEAKLGGDSDYYDINEANQGVRGDLPVQYSPDYTGFSDDMMPMDETRQTPMPSDQSDPTYRPNIGAPGAPGQANMGAYLNANRPAPPHGGAMTTEEELEDVSNKMGSGDPSKDGNFPKKQELYDLMKGNVAPEEFDAKWGKGAAKEMMSTWEGETEDSFSMGNPLYDDEGDEDD